MNFLQRAVKIYQEEWGASKLYTTREAAEQAGVSRQTLQAWVKAGKVKAAELTRPVRLRLWTKEDIVELRRVKRTNCPGRPRRKDSGEGNGGA